MQEIGNQAVWSLSSAKPGFGVNQLRDGNTESYWQSDGPQPHFINIQFHKRSVVQEVRIFADYQYDESYTPSKIGINIGTNFHNLQEIKLVEMEKPSGWITIPLSTETKKVKTNFIQIGIITNHQSGRDTHIRQISVYGPSTENSFSFDDNPFILR